MTKILLLSDFLECDLTVSPLLCGWDNERSDVYLPIELRKTIQELTFGRGRSGLTKFYRWCWENKPHVCEETGQYLQSYSACYVSHILSRGGWPEMAFDPRNINILSFAAHQQWEYGNKKTMRIFSKNEQTIQLLKIEYQSKIHKL